MKFILELLKKYKSVIMYLIFGVLTTAVNFVIYELLYNRLGISNFISNVIAVSSAIAFAFITNKLFVFESRGGGMRSFLGELWRFLAGRLASAVFEIGFMVLAVDLLKLNGTFMKLLSNIVVIILNYVFSKFWVFKNTKKEKTNDN